MCGEKMTSVSKETARVFKAFCDENRLQILELLRGGEKCACRLLEEMNITQPTLSHHMKVLCQTGLVSCRREGRWCHYSIDPAEAGMLASFFGELRCTAEAPRCVASCC